MSFKPQIPLAGLAGWRFLERTQATQQAAFGKGAALNREVEYFRENVGKISTAEELVADRRLLKVALGAFGLEGEIDKKAFVRKVLEGGVDDPSSLANKLTAPGFKKIAEAFGFGDAGGSRAREAGFADGIVVAYKDRAFEAAVGETNNDMRLAMNFRREIAALAGAGENGGSWYTVIGSSPLRKVIEKAYGLPSSFGQLDVDKQRDVLRDKTSALFGVSTLKAFADPANVEKLIGRFLVRAQLENGPSATAAGSAALTLLQNARGSSGLLNLITSQR